MDIFIGSIYERDPENCCLTAVKIASVVPKTFEAGTIALFKIPDDGIPVDCTNTISLKTLSQKEFAYGAQSAVILPSHEEVFTNSNKDNCPVTSCEIKATGCSNALPDSKVIIGNSSPFAISVASTTDSHSAKTYEICIKCTNSGGTQQKDNFRIIQGANPCLTSLSSKNLATKNVGYGAAT